MALGTKTRFLALLIWNAFSVVWRLWTVTLDLVLIPQLSHQLSALG